MQSPDCLECHSANTFSSSQSQSFTNTSEIKEIPYGKGYAKGYQCADTAEIGKIAIKTQSFILVDYEEDFEAMVADGVLGMAFPELSAMEIPLVLQMYEQKLIESPIFSVYLSNNDFGYSVEEMESSVLFGGIDLEKYSESGFLDYLELVYTGFWSVELTGIVVGGDTIDSVAGIAMMDSGTGLLVGPQKDVQAILSKLIEGKDCYSSSGVMVCSCTEKSEFDSIEFWLQGKKFVIMPEEYILMDKNQCALLLTSVGVNVWVLGDVFLRSYYTVYDMEKLRIGYTRAKTVTKVREAGDVKAYAAVLFVLIILGLAGGFFVTARYAKWRDAQNRRLASTGYVSMTNL